MSRQLDDELTALARIAGNPNLPAMVTDNVEADRKPQTGAALSELGRVKGLKDIVQFFDGNSRAVIFHDSGNPLLVVLDCCRYQTTLGFRGVDRVDQQICENLLELALVAPN